MSTVTKTFLVDDLDGSTGDVENVQIALDGASYELDLSADNAARLRDKLARFVQAATPVRAPKAAPAKRGPKTAVVASNQELVHDIRRWAAEAGIAVSPRGRLSADLVDKYNAVH